MKTTASPLTHSAISVDAVSGRDAIVYLSEDGDAKWGIRHDATDGSLEIRLQENGVNSKKFEITSSGEIKTGMRSKTKFISGLDILAGNNETTNVNGGVTIPSTSNRTDMFFRGLIELPNGSEITKVKLLYYDNSSSANFGGTSTAEFKRVSKTSPGNMSALVTIPSISTTSTSTSMRHTTVTTINNSIVSDNYFYVLSVLLEISNTTHNMNCRFYGVEITYNTDRLD